MKPTEALNPAQMFFWNHAGYGYNPKIETPAQGRTRSAIRLAEAEALYIEAHRVADVEITWEDDANEPDAEYRATCEAAIIWHRHGDGEADCLASLGAITDADINYRRVIRAELAMECADELRKIIDQAGKL